MLEQFCVLPGIVITRIFTSVNTLIIHSSTVTNADLDNINILSHIEVNNINYYWHDLECSEILCSVKIKVKETLLKEWEGVSEKQVIKKREKKKTKPKKEKKVKS